MSQSCVFLPYSQVQAFQFPVHISYFLQKCKKGKPSKKGLTLLNNDITTFELASGIVDTLQMYETASR